MRREWESADGAVAVMLRGGSTANEVAAATGEPKWVVYKTAKRMGLRPTKPGDRRRPTPEQWAEVCDPAALRAVEALAYAGTPAQFRRMIDRVEVSRDVILDRLIRDVCRRAAGRGRDHWKNYAAANCRSWWHRKTSSRPAQLPLEAEAAGGGGYERAEVGRRDRSPAAALDAATVIGSLDHSDAELVRDFFGIGRDRLTPQQMAAARGLRSRRAVEVRVRKVIARLRARFNPEGTQ